MLKKEVLDVEGRAVADTLNREGTAVSDCRVGKYIVLDIPTQDLDQAKLRATEIAKSVLANPLIEGFQIDVLEGNA